jgi:hypothetical protein
VPLCQNDLAHTLKMDQYTCLMGKAHSMGHNPIRKDFLRIFKPLLSKKKQIYFVNLHNKGFRRVTSILVLNSIEGTYAFSNLRSMDYLDNRNSYCRL